MQIDIFEQAHQFLRQRSFEEHLPARSLTLSNYNLGNPIFLGNFSDRISYVTVSNTNKSTFKFVTEFLTSVDV